MQEEEGVPEGQADQVQEEQMAWLIRRWVVGVGAAELVVLASQASETIGRCCARPTAGLVLSFCLNWAEVSMLSTPAVLLMLLPVLPLPVPVVRCSRLDAADEFCLPPMPP